MIELTLSLLTLPISSFIFRLVFATFFLGSPLLLSPIRDQFSLARLAASPSSSFSFPFPTHASQNPRRGEIFRTRREGGKNRRGKGGRNQDQSAERRRRKGKRKRRLPPPPPQLRSSVRIYGLPSILVLLSFIFACLPPLLWLRPPSIARAVRQASGHARRAD